MLSSELLHLASVGWSVGWLVGRLVCLSVCLSALTFFGVYGRFLHYCSCPPARDLGSRVYGLVIALMVRCVKQDQTISGGTDRHIHRQTDRQTDRHTNISYTCFGASKKHMVLCNHSNAEPWFGEYSQSLFLRELSERTESLESLGEFFESSPRLSNSRRF